MKNLREEIKKSRYMKPSGRISINCDDRWCNPYYAIANTFSDEEIEEMTIDTLNKLITLAENIGEILY